LSLCLTKHHVMKTYWGSEGIAPRILDLDTRRRWVVSFTPWPLYLQGRRPHCLLDRRLGGPQSQSERGEEENISSLYRESNPWIPIVQPVDSRHTDWATRLNTQYYVSIKHLIWRPRHRWQVNITTWRNSSVSVQTEYMREDRDSIPDRNENFFLGQYICTGSGAHPALGTEVPLPCGKAAVSSSPLTST
jgi:hypothetical protein